MINPIPLLKLVFPKLFNKYTLSALLGVILLMLAYSWAYGNGYDAGLEEGYVSGHADGHDDGLRHASVAAMQKALEDKIMTLDRGTTATDEAIEELKQTPLSELDKKLCMEGILRGVDCE